MVKNRIALVIQINVIQGRNYIYLGSLIIQLLFKMSESSEKCSSRCLLVACFVRQNPVIQFQSYKTEKSSRFWHLRSQNQQIFGVFGPK